MYVRNSGVGVCMWQNIYVRRNKQLNLFEKIYFLKIFNKYPYKA